MKINVLLIFILLVDCLAIAATEEKQVIKDKSPDGKFALLLTSGKEGWDTTIIDAKTKKKLFDLEAVATSGDKERTRWASSVDTFQIEDYAKDATLVNYISKRAMPVKAHLMVLASASVIH